MTQLNQAITALQTARQELERAKQNWLTKMDSGESDWPAARQAYLQKDYEFSGQASGLVGVLGELRQIFCQDLAIAALDDEQKVVLYRLIAEIGLDSLIAPFKASGLEELASVWRNATHLLDAAKALVEALPSAESAEKFEQSLQAVQDDFKQVAASEDPMAVLEQCKQKLRQVFGYTRDADAWLKAIAVYRLMKESDRFPSENLGQRIWDAANGSVRHLQAVEDQLIDQAQALLEDLYYDSKLDSALAELDDDLAQFVRDAVGSGLIPQRQAQPQKRTQTQTVTSTEGQTDEERSDEAGR